MEAPNRCVLFFMRAPEKGRVKTRLATSLGDDVALMLYRLFVLDLLEMLTKTTYPIILCGHPQEKISEIEAWLGPHLPCWPQRGESLGERMTNAFSRAFSEGYEQVVLIGSDIPDLPGRIIHQAFSAIDREGAVFGPALDGGYYLVAFRASAFLPEAFDHISWGSERVLEQTLAVFKERQTPVSLLDPWRDIDEIEDAKALLTKHPLDDTPAPRTLTLLRSLSCL